MLKSPVTFTTILLSVSILVKIS